MTHTTPETPLNCFLMYSLQAQRGPWLAWIFAHLAAGTQAEVAVAVMDGTAALMQQHGERARFELHFDQIANGLPKGKAWDAPDWTNGAVRLWWCQEDDEHPAPGQKILREIAPLTVAQRMPHRPKGWRPGDRIPS